MKTVKFVSLAFRLFVPGILLLCHALHAATFSNLPATVSNTYAGTITLLVSNIPTGDTVIVQKYLDLNANGVIDGNDFLVQQYQLTDGLSATYTNGAITVTNLNIAGDLNAATGAITCQLNFQNADSAQNVIGSYLYKISSPAGHFAPLTNGFTVTNFPYAQSFTGNVVSNYSATTLPYAVVFAFPPPSPMHGLGLPAGAVVANGSGSYALKVPLGTYLLLAFHTNYVANGGTSPLLNLTSGATISTNLSLTNASQTITGQLIDSTNSSVGIPGIFLGTTSTNGYVSTCVTDTNGNFTVGVVPGQWKISGEPSGLNVHGYLGLNGSVNVNAGTTGIQAALPRATALFYGSVKDTLGNPMPAVDIYGSDGNSQYAQDDVTDTNGNYFAEAVGGASWQVGVSGNNPSLTNYVVSQSAFTNILAGQAILQNFTVLLATNHLTGYVKDSSGNPISGVQVYALATISGTAYQTSTDTDTNGNYSLNVATGNWQVGVSCSGSSDSLGNLGNYQCPGNQSTSIAGNNSVVNFSIQSCNGILVLTTNLPNGVVNSYYSTTLQASSCSGNFNWTLSSGTLPPGITLYSGGPLNGTPTTNGLFNFTVRVTDGGNFTNYQALSLNVNTNSVTNSPPPVTIAQSGGQVVVYYPLSGTNFVLQTTTNVATGPWVPATNGMHVIAVTFSNNAAAAFFRLH